MTNKERVVDGLKHCGNENCDGCPYCGVGNCVNWLIRDSFEAITGVAVPDTIH